MKISTQQIKDISIKNIFLITVILFVMTKHVLQSVLDAKMVNYIVINRPYYIKLTVQQQILQHITAQAKLDAFAKNALHLITAFHKSRHDYVSNLRSNLVPDTYIRKKCIQRIFDQISQKVLYIWCKFRNIHQIIILFKLYDSGFGIGHIMPY